MSRVATRHGSRIEATTEAYEEWMAGFGPVDAAELAAKHAFMAHDAFRFLRATFYDWALRFPHCCGAVADAPTVLAVGDLHLENYGLWRDAEGRLVWGVNDFDEAAELPYSNDLVRLLTSAALASKVDLRSAAKAVLSGYSAAMESGGAPFVLAERHRSLQRLARAQLGHAVDTFWTTLTALPDYPALPAEPREILLGSAPDAVSDVRIRTRQAGLGSLGRTRATLTARWRGALVSREVKRVLPSAWSWAADPEHAGHTVLYAQIVDRAVRCPDPFLRVQGTWVVRRLAPDNKRIELPTLRHAGRRLRLLEAMGAEAANVHLGSPAAREAIVADLAERRPGWLADAAAVMVRDVEHRQEAWARHHRTAGPASSRLSRNGGARAPSSRRSS